MKEQMRPGSKRYGGPSMAADSRPVTDRSVIPADQVRSAPRVTVQAPNRHPGSVPAKSVVATSVARPAADPMKQRADVHSIPVHRTQPHHTPQEAPEEQTIVRGVPVNKRKLEAFSELLKATETKISDDPRAAGPALRELSDQLMRMHLDHVGELNRHAMGNTDQAIRDRVASARSDWARQSAGDPGRLMDAQRAMGSYKAHDPEGHAQLTELLNHSGLGDHPAMARFGAWVGRQRLPTGGTHYNPQAASKGSMGREYRAPAGAPSSMSKAGRLYSGSAK